MSTPVWTSRGSLSRRFSAEKMGNSRRIALRRRFSFWYSFGKTVFQEYERDHCRRAAP
jgi:hypothetical protein